MRFFQHRSRSKTITHTPKSVTKAGKADAPGIEILEARVNPTDVISSSLLFRGDLIADGNLWKSTGSPIEIGFNPTQGEAFRSLVTLKGDTVLDPAASKLDFQGVGAYSSPSGLVDFWSATTLSTFDIQKLVSVGETINPTSFVVSGLNFKPGNLRLENPNGGSTNDSILATQGRLELPLLSGFGVDVVDSNSVKIDPTQGIDLTGISTKLSGGSFKAGGASFETSGLTIGYAIQEKTFSVYGSAKVSFGTNSITTSFGDSATPGLSIANGDISTFNASLSGSFSLSGTTITADKLALSYARPDDTLNITGGASIAFGSNTASLALNNKGIVIQAGLIQSIDATVDGQFTVAGAAINLSKLTVA
jgi:hypothetical protein